MSKPLVRNDQVAKALFTKTEEADRKVAERVARGSCEVEVFHAHRSHLAWLLQKEEVTAPIIGATKISHLEDAVIGVISQLTSEEIKILEELYVPPAIRWYKCTTSYRANT